MAGPKKKQKQKTKKASATRDPLEREKILEAAVALADADGVGSLSMRRLAGEVGVEAMSLYHHFANKDEILDGMVDLVFGEIELPNAKQDWRTGMRTRALSARAALSRHPWAVGLMDSPRNPGLATMRHHDRVLGCLRRADFSLTLCAHAVALIDSYIYGFVLQEISLPFDNSEELQAIGDEVLPRLPVEEFPHLVEMFHHALQPGYSFANQFHFGLDLILDGLERKREAD